MIIISKVSLGDACWMLMWQEWMANDHMGGPMGELWSISIHFIAEKNALVSDDNLKGPFILSISLVFAL